MAVRFLSCYMVFFCEGLEPLMCLPMMCLPKACVLLMRCLQYCGEVAPFTDLNEQQRKNGLQPGAWMAWSSDTEQSAAHLASNGNPFDLSAVYFNARPGGHGSDCRHDNFALSDIRQSVVRIDRHAGMEQPKNAQG